jgi:drug/metabolite transporter (DMT)-like permease
MLTKNSTMAGHGAALMTIFVWGMTFISTKILLRDFTPVEILFFRFSLGFIALLLVYPRRLKTAGFKQEVTFAGAGLCGVTLYFLFENIALIYSTASNVGVIVAVSPFFTAVLASVFLAGERLTARFFIGFVAAITGLALISFNGSQVLRLNPLGDFLAMLAAAVWAVYSILTRKISGYGYNTVQTTRRIFFYGLLFMLPTLFFFDFRWDLGRFARPVNLLNILFLGFGASALCFATWNFAVSRLGAIKTSVYIYIIPVVTVLTAMLVLDEKVTGLMAAGIGLTILGLLISESKSWLGRR